MFRQLIRDVNLIWSRQISTTCPENQFLRTAYGYITDKKICECTVDPVSEPEIFVMLKDNLPKKVFSFEGPRPVVRASSEGSVGLGAKRTIKPLPNIKNLEASQWRSRPRPPQKPEFVPVVPTLKQEDQAGMKARGSTRETKQNALEAQTKEPEPAASQFVKTEERPSAQVEHTERAQEVSGGQILQSSESRPPYEGNSSLSEQSPPKAARCEKKTNQTVNDSNGSVVPSRGNKRMLESASPERSRKEMFSTQTDFIRRSFKESASHLVSRNESHTSKKQETQVVEREGFSYSDVGGDRLWTKKNLFKHHNPEMDTIPDLRIPNNAETGVTKFKAVMVPVQNLSKPRKSEAFSRVPPKKDLPKMTFVDMNRLPEKTPSPKKEASRLDYYREKTFTPALQKAAKKSTFLDFKMKRSAQASKSSDGFDTFYVKINPVKASPEKVLKRKLVITRSEEENSKKIKKSASQPVNTKSGTQLTQRILPSGGQRKDPNLQRFSKASLSTSSSNTPLITPTTQLYHVVNHKKTDIPQFDTTRVLDRVKQRYFEIIDKLRHN